MTTFYKAESGNVLMLHMRNYALLLLNKHDAIAVGTAETPIEVSEGVRGSKQFGDLTKHQSPHL